MTYIGVLGDSRTRLNVVLIDDGFSVKVDPDQVYRFGEIVGESDLCFLFGRGGNEVVLPVFGA